MCCDALFTVRSLLRRRADRVTERQISRLEAVLLASDQNFE